MKPDTIRNVLQSLCRCEGAERVNLIVWQDGLAGSRRQDEFEAHWGEVNNFITSFAAAKQSQFHSIEIKVNRSNMGPCKTCQVALDYAFESHEFAVFTEDDVIFSRDALVWFQENMNSGILEDEAVWAIAAESIFFDSRDKSVSPEFVGQAISAALEKELTDKYILVNFLPSSCFATDRRRWLEFGETRGEPIGDVIVCNRCKSEGRRCVLPVVARGKDVGMLHDLGYSVTIHTKSGVVSSAKNAYLLAEDLLPAGPIGTLRLERFMGDQGLLFAQTTALEGFSRGSGSVDLQTRATAAENLIARARDAFKLRDLTEALRLWKAVLWQYPENVAGYAGIGETLRDLGRLDEAEALLSDAIQRFPEHEWPAVKHAEVAVLRKDWATALARWNDVCEAFPDRPIGHIGKGETLTRMGRFDEADEALGQAVRTFPDDRWAATQYAETASQRKDWPEALRRWRNVTAKFPDHAVGFAGLATTLRELARYDEADPILSEAIERFPADEWVAISYAQTAMQRRDWKEAARRWDMVIRRFAYNPAGYVGRATALIEAGDLAEAERVLYAAAQQFPRDQSLANCFLMLATRRGPIGCTAGTL